MTETISAQAIISVKAQLTLLKDTYRRRHIEACGLLTGCMDEGGNWHIERAHPLRNIYNSPVYFEFSPEDVLTVELDHPGKIIGAYHSHPTGYAKASSTDRQNMKRVNLEQQIPWVWLIISGPFDETSASFRQAQSPRGKGPSITAYHHYERLGLQLVPIQFAHSPAASPGMQEQNDKTIGHDGSHNEADAL
jgi:[CysO sulfur-carrier protein]-S-L-cysteine hydrolase